MSGFSGSHNVDASYIHYQPSPVSSWMINHNLGFRPNVMLLNSGSMEVEAEVVHISEDLVAVLFVLPMAGMARCH